jgi:hypothetical protein
MSDEQLPTRAELASAYLDGDLEADERSTVESDPDAMAMVEAFAGVRAELQAAEPVDDVSRSAAITAALAEFDARRETSNGGVVTPLKSRRLHPYRILTGVAAAAVVVIVGIAAINSSNHDDDTFSAAVTTEQTGELPQIKIAADTSAADAGGTAPAGGAAASIESAATSLPQINSKDDLEAYAAGFLSGASAPAPAATTAAAIPNVADSRVQSACVSPGQTMLGEILYQGTPALVVYDDTAGNVEAINTADCAVLETVP